MAVTRTLCTQPPLWKVEITSVPGLSLEPFEPDIAPQAYRSRERQAPAGLLPIGESIAARLSILAVADAYDSAWAHAWALPLL